MGYSSSMRVEKTEAYREWLDALKDRAGRARILVRVERLIEGNPGQHRQLTEGIAELKIDFGPGYRVSLARVIAFFFCWPVVTSHRSTRTSPRPLNWQRILRSSLPCPRPSRRSPSARR